MWWGGTLLQSASAATGKDDEHLSVAALDGPTANTADILIDTLIRWDVKLVFGIPFQEQVVMQLLGGVLLYDEAQSRGGRNPMLAGTLGGFREIALGSIEVKRRLRHHAP